MPRIIHRTIPSEFPGIRAKYARNLHTLYVPGISANHNFGYSAERFRFYSVSDVGTIAASPIGPGLYGDGSTDDYSCRITASETTSTTKFGALCSVYWLTTPATDVGFMEWTNLNVPKDSTARLNMQRQTNNLRFYIDANYRITESGVFTPNTLHHVFIRYDGTTYYAYRNGRQIGSYAGGFSHDGGYIWFGSGYNGHPNAVIPIGAFWTDDPGDGAARELSLNPLRIFEPSFRKSYIAVAAASGRIMSSLTRHGGLAGSGGIAGVGGGLAA